MELGTAVGIASFGIQICQRLLWYYDAWKGYDSDISSAYEAITDLRKTLTLLIGSLQSGNVDKERAERVQTCLQSCVDALRKLEEERHNLQEHNIREGTRERVRSALQRSRYPFKKASLNKLKDNVAEVQERLKFALQVLQLDINIASRDLLLQLSAEQQTEEYKKIVAWLCAADPWTNHESARGRREKSTGNWLLQSNYYQKWKLGKGGRVWMCGKAGCGKTVLCSTAIEDIQIHCGRSADSACAFFYFTFSDEHKQSNWELLRSLVAQLGWREPGLSMLRQAYKRPNRSTPGPDELQKILMTCIKSWKVIFLFLDAIDECPEEQDIRQGVIDRIETLITHAPNLNIFATSRELPQVRESMDALGFESLRIVTSAVDADIGTYISTQLSRDRHFQKFEPATLGLIKTTILGKSDGMFRWAYCQLQELKKLKSTAPKYVRQALDTLPATLDETYTRTLLNIEDMYHEHAIILLHWLAYARSPPTLTELVEAAITDPIHASLVDIHNRGNLEDTLNILSGLVIVEESEDPGVAMDLETKAPNRNISTAWLEQADAILPYRPLTPNTRVRLAHFSIKEYLESRRIRNSGAGQFHLESALGHKFLALSCLMYLQHYSSTSERTSTKQDLKDFPLLQYAARSWSHHSALQADNHFISGGSLLQSEDATIDWLLVCDPDDLWKPPFQHPQYVGSALYYASRLGLGTLVRNLLRSGSDINAQSGRFGNALQAASFGGFADVVQLLLENGADVNAACGEYSNALHAASENGHTEVIKLLLNSGANMSVQNGRFGDALQLAAFEGHIEGVRLLLEKGADVNALCGDDGNALQAASRGGHTAVVQLLVDNGANVNTTGGEYGNALQAASLEGHVDVVRLLLEEGANPLGTDGPYGSALEAASGHGCTEVVELMFNEHSGCQAGPVELGNALQLASKEGFLDVVQTLLDEGAEVDWKGGLYGNALKAASYGGHEEMVELLLNRGADPLARGGRYDTALQAASAAGCTKAVQMLLEQCGDVNVQGGKYGTALQAASFGVQEEILCFLLDDDVFGEASSMSYDEALHKAADGSHAEVVQLLLNKGADVNVQGGRYGNALQAASRVGHTEVVKLLLDKGADVNAQGGEFCNALQAALAGGKREVVKLLKAAGAQGSLTDNDGLAEPR